GKQKLLRHVPRSDASPMRSCLQTLFQGRGGSMIISNYKPEEKERLEKKFHTFLFKLIDVAKYSPKERYLFPIMEGVPFRGLEVALDMAMIERSKAND